MAYTPYYSGGWQSGEEGGTPITPAALNNIENGIGTLDTTHNVLTYTSVTQLNLTAGSATILGAYNAMSDNSVLYAHSSDFSTSELPSSAGSDRAGIVAIIKRQNTRTYVAFWAKYAAGRDYRMYQGATAYNNQDNNAPTGNWIQMAMATPVIYSVRGQFVLSATTGTTVGYGKATVTIIGAIVTVVFTAKVITAGTSNDVTDIGIQVSTLRSLNTSIPEFTVGNGGVVNYFNASGALDVPREGYAGEGVVNTNGNYWAFGRIYSDGLKELSDVSYTAGQYITGTLYGTLN